MTLHGVVEGDRYQVQRASQVFPTDFRVVRVGALTVLTESLFGEHVASLTEFKAAVAAKDIVLLKVGG